MYNNLTKSHFINSVITLAGGTASAQLIYLISLPILSRLYTPDSFGYMAIFSSIVAITNVIATGRYEEAIIACKTNKIANVLALLIYRLSIVIALSSLFLGLLYFFVMGRNNTSLLVAVLGAPIGIFLNANYLSFYYLNNKLQNYKIMTRGRVWGATSTSFVSVLLGMNDIFKDSGLILGIICGLFINYYYLKLRTTNYDRDKFTEKQILAVAKLFKRFPKILVFSSFLDRLGSQFHVMVFSSFFSAEATGSLALHNRVVSLPIVIIARSIGDVFKRKASDSLNSHGMCLSEFKKAVTILAIVAAPISIILFFFGPILFVIVFGDEWKQAGEISSILAFNFFLAFVVSPISSLIYLGKNQKFDIFIQMLLLFLLVSKMGYCVLVKNLMFAVYLCAVSYCLKYLMEFFVCWRIASGSLHRN